ncbi:MAG: ATP-binding protein [Candidatus Omnitrophota bacterium]|nr:ATP-binding protein [Candidatus Omnitrophota bacterium]
MIIEHKIKSNLKAIPQFTLSIFKKLEATGINEDILFDIRLSLEEALINAVKHGNKMQKDKEVSFKIKVLPKSVEMEIKDQGKGFDYKNIPIPTDEKNLEKTSGRGVFLIKKLMDKVEFLDGGSRIKMVKFK